MNRKVVTILLSLVLFSSCVFYVASAKNDRDSGSPWESILDVFVKGGEVNISRPITIAPGQEVSVSEPVTVEGQITIAPNQGVRIDGPVTIQGPVTLEPGSTVETIMATEVVELFYGRLNPAQLETWYVDVDGYETVHVYFIYDVVSYPDAYALAWDFSIPNPYGGPRLTWNTEYLPGPGVYTFEVTGPQLYLSLHGWQDADQTDCKVFVYAQSG